MAVIKSKKANMILVRPSNYTLLAMKVTKVSRAKSESKSNISQVAKRKELWYTFSPTRKSSYASYVMDPPGQLSFKLPSAADVHADADAGFDRAGVLDGDVGHAVEAALHHL